MTRRDLIVRLVAVALAGGAMPALAADVIVFSEHEMRLVAAHPELAQLMKTDPAALRKAFDETRIPDAGGRSSAEASYDLLQLLKKAGRLKP
jgi:hypothetical protein